LPESSTTAARGITFGLGSFEAGATAFTGIVLDDSVVVPVEALDADLSGYRVQDFFDRWDAMFPALRRLAADAHHSGTKYDLGSVRVLPPHRPTQIIQAGANFREHVMQLAVAQMVTDHAFDEGKPDSYYARLARESIDERARSGEPYVFLGAPSAMCGAYDDVLLPKRGVEHDWELEMAAVIGTSGHDIPVDKALDHVAGWTIVNDVSTRDLVFRPDLASIGTDWFRGKNAPTFLPTGPWIVPAEFVPDPQDVHIQLRLNGELMQDGSTSDMIFGFARLISYASQTVTLLPGDLVLSGSPAGNGAHYKRYLRDGDVMESTLTGLGRQRNTCRPA
jgi:2,4-didehydro-3-deoxy-L-rhamnonate hydrolase